MANPDNKTFKAKPFQVFGFDILIDDKMKSWILEINDHPSFNILTCKEFMGCRHDNCPVSDVDLYVKKRVMTDVLKLAFKSRRHESIAEIEDSFGSL